MQRVEHPDQLYDRTTLASIIGATVRDVARAPLATGGYTGASHERLALTLEGGVRRALVLKRVRPSRDWTALRTGDPRGREAMMLVEPALAPIWDTFGCPYLAAAITDDEIGLLMDDLSAHLLPDRREPLRDEEEAALLGALAAMHARFSDSSALDLSWLARPAQFAELLDARCAGDDAARRVFPAAFGDNLTRGWSIALARAPRRVTELMAAPAVDLESFWRGLPRTLVHGDAKVANFARLADGRVAAFDWAMLGAAPAAVDLGWYIAVNASRLTGSKEDALSRYRALAERARRAAFDAETWRRSVRAAIVIGARMLLWSKALAFDADRPGARAEWDWWIDQLVAIGE